jgi:hypothetical protein
MEEIEEALQELEDRLDADEENELFCVACNKEMRNEKAFAAHRQQKYDSLAQSLNLIRPSENQFKICFAGSTWKMLNY